MNFNKTRLHHKIALRAEALLKRDSAKPKQRKEWDYALSEQALLLGARRSEPSKFYGAGPVAGYWPMRSEVDTRRILTGLTERGLPLCLPAIAAGRLVFRSWQPEDELVPGGFGTLVPSPKSEIVQPTVLLVPLVAFDRRGFRIGYGKGLYDKALAELPNALTIGLGYAIQEIDHVPNEPHDIPLDMIVTESDVFKA